MPFGKKEVSKEPRADLPTDPDTKDQALIVDFDAVYRDLFKPALEAAELQPFRADDEKAGEDILKDMFAELVTADFVLADISILNANVFYELGIRHTVGPRGVICLHAGWADRPFDVAPQRTFRYDGTLFTVGRDHDGAWAEQLAAAVRRLTDTLSKAVAADKKTEGSPVYANLPNLQPPDASRISTAQFKYYQALAVDWKQRVAVAAKDGRAEDILTLSGDVPSPYYRRKLLRQCAEALLALGRFAQSEKILRELSDDLDGTDSADEFRAKCQLALLANRLNRPFEAQQKLVDLAQQTPGDSEGQGLLGRVYKDIWRTAWSAKQNLQERLSVAWQKAAVARKSLATYEVALRHDMDTYYNGVNVITLAALLKHVATENRREATPEVPDFEDLTTIVRLAAMAKVEDENESVWARATLGEVHLVLGHGKEALDNYEQATADPNLTWFNIRSMFEQVQLFKLLGYRPDTVEPVATLLQQRLDELPHPSARFDKIVVCSGHMIDTPDRRTPRFPAAKAEAVRTEIAKRLAQWGVHAGDLAVCGGACGADILFAEECQRRGAKIRLLLTQEVEGFVRDSVQHAGSDWVQRFQALRQSAELATQSERLGKTPPDLSIYARNNLWIINTAWIEGADSAKIHALLVWDRKPTGDGLGGTSDFAAKVRDLGALLEIIDPTTVP